MRASAARTSPRSAAAHAPESGRRFRLSARSIALETFPSFFTARASSRARRRAFSVAAARSINPEALLRPRVIWRGTRSGPHDGG